MPALKRLGLDPKVIEKLILKKYSLNQSQTKEAFSFKWSKRNTYESEAVKDATQKWLLERYCDGDSNRLNLWLKGSRKIILDAGCGSGFSALLFFGQHLKHHDYLGIDISDSIEIARTRFKESGYDGDFLQISILDLPIKNESTDIIFSEGTLHHTDNTKESIVYLSKKLKKDGKFLFYVYRKKAVIREFTDDYIRNHLRNMNNAEAWEALKPLTKLGIELGKLNVDVDIPDDIPFLGIKKGKTNLQRFFYYYICKAFYRPDYNLEEMNHTNFDWFRPLNCHRHTVDEIKSFCKEAHLKIERMNVQESGITVVAKRI